MAKPLLPTVGTSPGRAPAGVHPEVWRLRLAVVAAREALPYATAEARLLDGLRWWLQAASSGRTAADRRLGASGPAWAEALVLVSAIAAVCSPATRTLLAPWVVRVAAAGAPAPTPGAGLDFRPFGG